jgi:hypothetical protein
MRRSLESEAARVGCEDGLKVSRSANQLREGLRAPLFRAHSIMNEEQSAKLF